MAQLRIAINVILPVAGVDYVGPLPAELQGLRRFRRRRAGGVEAARRGACAGQVPHERYDRSHTLGGGWDLSHAPLAPVFSRRHPGGLPLQGVDPEAGAGNVLVIHDHNRLAIRPDFFRPITASSVSDLEDFVG
jgi:hypothetical protein